MRVNESAQLVLREFAPTTGLGGHATRATQPQNGRYRPGQTHRGQRTAEQRQYWPHAYSSIPTGNGQWG
jgi:hypothetical protein